MNASKFDYEYLVAFLLEPMQPGETFVGWPLHITLIPSWIRLNNEEKLVQGLRKVAKNFQPFTAVGTIKTWFGRHKKLPVTLVEATTLYDLHGALLAFLKQQNYVFQNTKYMGRDYTPHVTKKKNSELKPGEQLLIDRFEVFKAPATDPLERQKTLVATFEFTKKAGNSTLQ